jgi:hypothetical protein
MRTAGALLHHFNPACRAARRTAELSVSRLLILLNDFDLPMDNIHRMYYQSTPIFKKVVTMLGLNSLDKESIIYNLITCLETFEAIVPRVIYSVSYLLISPIFKLYATLQSVVFELFSVLLVFLELLILFCLTSPKFTGLGVLGLITNILLVYIMYSHFNSEFPSFVQSESNLKRKIIVYKKKKNKKSTKNNVITRDILDEPIEVIEKVKKTKKEVKKARAAAAAAALASFDNVKELPQNESEFQQKSLNVIESDYSSDTKIKKKKSSHKKANLTEDSDTGQESNSKLTKKKKKEQQGLDSLSELATGVSKITINDNQYFDENEILSPVRKVMKSQVRQVNTVSKNFESSNIDDSTTISKKDTGIHIDEDNNTTALLQSSTQPMMLEGPTVSTTLKTNAPTLWIDRVAKPILNNFITDPDNVSEELNKNLKISEFDKTQQPQQPIQLMTVDKSFDESLSNSIIKTSNEITENLKEQELKIDQNENIDKNQEGKPPRHHRSRRHNRSSRRRRIYEEEEEDKEDAFESIKLIEIESNNIMNYENYINKLDEEFYEDKSSFVGDNSRPSTKKTHFRSSKHRNKSRNNNRDTDFTADQYDFDLGYQQEKERPSSSMHGTSSRSRSRSKQHSDSDQDYERHHHRHRSSRSRHERHNQSSRSRIRDI